jgi:hypothetical protein
MRKSVFSLLLILSVFSCDLEDDVTDEEQRAIDAGFNGSITPGVSNVFYESKLVSNAESQLVFKLTYHEDTLTAYGKINGSGSLEFIHTTVLMKKGGREYLVTEIDPESKTSWMYGVIDNVRSKLVVETRHVDAARQEISIIDVNWESGEENVVLSTLLDGGLKKGEFSSLRVSNERAWNCDKPQPSEDINKTVDNHLDYHACGGLAWDTHPSLNAIKETITSSLEKIRKSGQYSDRNAELSFLENMSDQLRNLYSSIKGNVGAYRFEKSRLAGLLKQLEESINKLKKEQFAISLTIFEAGTHTEYDEVTDRDIKITFTVNDQKTNLPFTDRPVWVDMAVIIPGTTTALDLQSKATSTANGMVTFRFDPTMIPEYEKYTNLQIQWDLTAHSWQKSLFRDVSLKFIEPKVVFKDGSALTSPIVFTKDQFRNFKLVNEDGRAITQNYDKLSFDNITNEKLGYWTTIDENEFSMQLYSNESTDQQGSLDVYYNSKKIQTMNLLLSDSTEIYRLSAMGSYVVTNFKGNGPNSRLYCELEDHGIARFTIYDDPSWNDGHTWRVSWGIARAQGKYYVSIAGWYNGYPSINEDAPISYPVTSFGHHLDNLYMKQ